MIKGYLDNAATTPLCDEVKTAISEAMDRFANPSSLYSAGLEAAKAIDEVRSIIANFIKAKPQQIYFTSGGTESDNLAVKGAANALKRRGNRIVTTAIEHSAVLNSVKQLEAQGFEAVYIKPDSNGNIPIEAFEEAIDEKTVLVSAMWVNNETGVFLPVDKIKSIIKRKKAPALFHCDATQGFGKYPIYPAKLGIDLMSAAAHKIHAPKGVGFLYIADGVRILPVISGGEQQNGLRPGTEPDLLISGFGAGINAIGDMKQNAENAAMLKKYIIDSFSDCDDVLINSPEHSSEYVVNISVLGIRSETMLHFCEQKGIYISSASACSKGKSSYVLGAAGFDSKRIDSALRISFSRFNTLEDVKLLVEAINEARTKLIRAK